MGVVEGHRYSNRGSTGKAEGTPLERRANGRGDTTGSPETSPLGGPKRHHSAQGVPLEGLRMC